MKRRRADAAVELASELSIALLAVLERLAPEERAAFLLKEMFDSDYGDIAQILGKSEVATRQIVSRANKRVRAERPRVEVSVDAKKKLLMGWWPRCRRGTRTDCSSYSRRTPRGPPTAVARRGPRAR